ncbi:recombinase family protein [Micromonospora sp. NPDC047465]|uniref:recombinase family protein n=1 Tax=Micromonospora sp. NPDC047465 TaxID=3154813 RepID=UPI0033F289C4
MIALPPLVAYLRVSTDRQAEDGYGLDVQTEAIKAWAKTNKRRIIDWHRDDASGTLAERDGWADVEHDIATKRAGGVVMFKLDRLARDMMIQETFMQAIWKLDGEVYSTAPNENNLRDDPEDPTRKFVRRMFGLMAEYERDMIVLRMRRGRRMKATKGGYAYGSPAFGQRSVNKQLVKDPTEQKTLKRLIELRQGGASTRQVAAQLNAEGHTTKRGRQWTSAGVSDVLRRHATGRHRGKTTIR